jgi:DNA invertase Pin-like site-specific DNA recombinase
MKVAIYLRVSTDRQTTESQAVELREYCARRGWIRVLIPKSEPFLPEEGFLPA